ncbi:hypothetical protein HYH03_015387 [Edaphochlamys debaryana]|uniref:Uncharacterized protein n=1 Tax=Edaphochlamys debaryana TaxID=47281 RepID=A0A835XKU6_9CHLO|nr:hypothetical protein HYH03_015387 [Edaphochlamys debaryana]|eukprot:KAG2485943.1 hypothetical protein HYH03_015387 [Edaphochlamys debaryana]
MPGAGWPEAEVLRELADATLVLHFEDGARDVNVMAVDIMAEAALPSGGELCARLLAQLHEVLIQVEVGQVSKPPDGYFGVMTKAGKRGTSRNFHMSTEFARRHLPMLVAPLDAAESAASAGMAAAEPVLSLKGAAEARELKLLCFMGALAEAADGARPADVFRFVRHHISWFNFSELFVTDTTLRWWPHETIMAYTQNRVQVSARGMCGTPARVLRELAALLHYLGDFEAKAEAEIAQELAEQALQALTDPDVKVERHEDLRSRLVPLVEARLGKINALGSLLAHAGKHPDRAEERLDVTPWRRTAWAPGMLGCAALLLASAWRMLCWALARHGWLRMTRPPGGR